MPYVIAKTEKFKTPVTVYTPNMQGGHDVSEFFALFKKCDQTEIERLRTLKLKETVAEVLIGWDDFLDEDSRPVEFNVDTKAALLSVPEALLALTQAFWGSIYKAHEKN